MPTVLGTSRVAVPDGGVTNSPERLGAKSLNCAGWIARPRPWPGCMTSNRVMTSNRITTTADAGPGERTPPRRRLSPACQLPSDPYALASLSLKSCPARVAGGCSVVPGSFTFEIRSARIPSGERFPASGGYL